ncbi:MAG: hypothetical protein Q4D99_06890, partial [Bacillota bacterium]|nr:hypothetical protein [Bacillota bacterium]
PQYAVISVGADNSYGHPTAETLNKLEDAQVELFRTDWNGDVVCTSDGASLSFSLEKEPEMLTLPGAPESYEGQPYQDVVSAFAAAGFTNVQATGSEIDPDNSWDYSGAVVSVVVGTATIADTEAEYAETTPISIAYVTYDEEAKEKLIAERKKAEADAKKKAEKKSEKKSEKKPAKKTEEKTQPEEKVIPQTDYVLNTNTKKFHYSYCKSVKRMKEKNTSYFTGARSDVIAMGYSPCQNCNP